MCYTVGMENWLPIPGYEQFYEISDGGRVRTLRFSPPKIMSLNCNGSHFTAHLYKHGKREVFYVHRLVLAVFKGPCPDGQEVRHLDGDPSNNSLNNLVYGTTSENRYDSVIHGTHVRARATHCPSGHEYTPENIYTPPSRPDTRYCRKCMSAKAARNRIRRLNGELPAPKCENPDCDTPAVARKMCPTHYAQWRRHQDK